MQGQCPGHTMYNNFIKPLIFASWNIKKKYLFCPIFGPDFIQYLGASTDFSWYKDGYLEIMFLTQGSCHNKKCWHSMMFAPTAIFDCSSLFSSSLLHTVFLIHRQHSHIVTNFFFIYFVGRCWFFGDGNFYYLEILYAEFCNPSMRILHLRSQYKCKKLHFLTKSIRF